MILPIIVFYSRYDQIEYYFSEIFGNDIKCIVLQDLSSQDINRNRIFLICYAIRTGGMDTKENEAKRLSMASSVLHAGNKNKLNASLSSSSSSMTQTEQMRRPIGVAAVDLTPVIKQPEDFKNNLDLPFIFCEKDNLDATLKKLIYSKDVGKIESKLAVHVELLHGDVKQVSEIFLFFQIQNKNIWNAPQYEWTLLITKKKKNPAEAPKWYRWRRSVSVGSSRLNFSYTRLITKRTNFISNDKRNHFFFH